MKTSAAFLSILFFLACGSDDPSSGNDAATTGDATNTPDTSAGGDTNPCFTDETVMFRMELGISYAGMCPLNVNTCLPGSPCGKTCNDVQPGSCANTRAEFIVIKNGPGLAYRVAQEGWAIVGTPSHGTVDSEIPQKYNDVPEDTEITVMFEDNMQRPGSARFTISADEVVFHEYNTPGLNEER